MKIKKVVKIDDAIIEARRFIKKATAWKIIMQQDILAVYGSKEGGAAKRASLDLTRALAELRKP